MSEPIRAGEMHGLIRVRCCVVQDNLGNFRGFALESERKLNKLLLSLLKAVISQEYRIPVITWCNTEQQMTVNFSVDDGVGHCPTKCDYHNNNLICIVTCPQVLNTPKKEPLFTWDYYKGLAGILSTHFRTASTILIIS